MRDIENLASALGHLRILDLSDEKGVYCAKLLADLGADTIKVECPGGDRLRRLGPFVGDERDPEKSLFHFHSNTNKRGITLNLEHPEGQRLFRELARTADIVIESFRPGYLSKLGLGYEDLVQVNPGLVMTSITPFGQYGPHAHYEGSDLVAWAMSGYMAILGYEDLDLPPLNAPFLQCCQTAGYYGAIGALAAIQCRAMIGRGQLVDVSMQEAMASMSESPNVFYSQNDVIVSRRWGYNGNPSSRRIFRTRDGYVDVSLGPLRPDHWPRIVEWMKSDGQAGDLDDEKWQDHAWGMDHIDSLYEQFEAWTQTHTGYELFHEGQKRRLEAAPVNDIPAVLEDAQLNARGFFVNVEHPELGRTLTYPGAPYDFTETPWRIRRRAPLIGEHNREIYLSELGLSEKALADFRARGII